MNVLRQQTPQPRQCDFQLHHAPVSPRLHHRGLPHHRPDRHGKRPVVLLFCTHCVTEYKSGVR
ncbi:hypothetical protein E2C01_010911 [Portunus trituberculatus]|uniref:Uncharacterized protein n=1 Tax=Portunus trituberculatus TaxID=210409 RepID=A0A5B7D9M1_PORTR|nr:hypothetical protein [Portunus trituberculatus]